MTVNVAGLRFIADAVEKNGDHYVQFGWGAGIHKLDAAGSGVSCGTPACVAGFAVQFLGNPKDYEVWFKNDRDNRFSMIGYAQDLLGLPEEWTDAIFRNGEWPLHWVYEPKHRFWDNWESYNREKFVSSKLYPIPRGRSVNYDTEGVRTPNHKQAATFLRRLADQFEAEQGVNINVHNPVHAEVYE